MSSAQKSNAKKPSSSSQSKLRSTIQQAMGRAPLQARQRVPSPRPLRSSSAKTLGGVPSKDRITPSGYVSSSIQRTSSQRTLRDSLVHSGWQEGRAPIQHSFEWWSAHGAQLDIQEKIREKAGTLTRKKYFVVGASTGTRQILATLENSSISIGNLPNICAYTLDLSRNSIARVLSPASNIEISSCVTHVLIIQFEATGPNNHFDDSMTKIVRKKGGKFFDQLLSQTIEKKLGEVGFYLCLGFEHKYPQTPKKEHMQQSVSLVGKLLGASSLNPQPKHREVRANLNIISQTHQVLLSEQALRKLKR